MNSKSEKWVPIVLLLVFVCFCVCMSYFVGFGVTRHKGIWHRETIETHQLYSIQNTSQQEGKIHGKIYASIGYISGSIDNKEYVYIYEGTDDNTIKMHKYSYNDIEFKFINENEKPYIETYTFYRVDTLITNSIKEYNNKKLETVYDNEYKYIIHIPENSILNTCDLNLKNLE